jgi:acetate kinase
VSGQVEGIGATPEITLKTADGERIHRAVPTGGSQGEQHRDALKFTSSRCSTATTRRSTSSPPATASCTAASTTARPRGSTRAVLRTLDTFVPLAPLHQPHNLRAVRAVAMLMPEVPQVGCFDTAFHRTQPAVAQAFALPRKLSAEGIKRYGFHGLSYDYVARQLPEIIGERAKGAVVIAHLGNGASMCALRDGKSVASTMGFTAVEGLMMGTRTGSLDPGILLHLWREGWSLGQVEKLLYKQSGLLGVSGGRSADMRRLHGLVDATADGASEAGEAIALFNHRLRREAGALIATLGGLDLLAFTGGIGEHDASVRAALSEGLGYLGVQLDAEANLAADGSAALPIHASGSRVQVWVVPTDEGRVAAQAAWRLLGS